MRLPRHGSDSVDRPGHWTRRAVIGAAGAAALAACSTDRSPVATPTFVPPRGMVTVPLPGARPGQTLATWRRDIAVVAQQGIRMVRAPMSSYVGAASGVSAGLSFSDSAYSDTMRALEAAREAGLSVMVVTPGHPGGGISQPGPAYADRVHTYVDALAGRLRDLVDAWQLFNEPDQADFRAYFPVPLTDQYIVDLAAALKAGRQAVHGRSPGVVFTSSLGGYPCDSRVEKVWRSFLDVTAAELDVVALDCYCGTSAALLDQLPVRIQRIVSTYAKPVWITETGLPVTGHAALGSTQLTWGSRHIRAARLGGAQVVGWYDLRDPVGRATETGYGLIGADWRPKPGFRGLMKELG